MRFRIFYTYYKTGDSVYSFEGTLDEWQAYMKKVGGCFTEVDRIQI